MEVTEVKKQIKDKNLQHYYVFTGEEITVMNIFVNKIAETAGLTIARVESLASVFNKIQNRSFISKPYCYVIRDDKDIMSQEKLWPQLESGEIQADNIIILLYTSIDKRSKFYKHTKDSLVEFNALTEQNLRTEILKRINLTDSNIGKLIDVCRCDFGRILLEIDKIQTYANSVNVTDDHNAIFSTLLKSGVIFTPPEDAIFKFVDAVLMRKPNLAFELLEQCYAVGENTMVLLSVMYNDTKALLQVQTCDSPDISATTGLSGWDIKRTRPRCGKYRPGELVTMMELIRSAEVGIKTGSIDESLAVHNVLVNIF